MSKQTKNGETRVIVVNIGWSTSIAVPTEAALRALLDVLARCQVVDHDFVAETYWRQDEQACRIEYTRVPATRVHLDEERPPREPRPAAIDIPPELVCPPRGSLAYQQLLLENLRK